MTHGSTISLLATCGLLGLLAGCAHYPVNPPLDRYDADAGYRTRLLDSNDRSGSLLVILAFSGGGTRAAALSYGVLQALADQTIYWNGGKRRLLDEVDIISAVSGGAFTAAYYGLFGDRIFVDYPDRFLHRNLDSTYKRVLVNPLNWFRLASNNFGRSELAAEYFDKNLFDGATFDTMLNSKGPAIIINSTDLSTGLPFVFTQDQFDWICSDLRGVPVARAVAASSALPPILSAVTFNNYAGTCGFDDLDRLETALESDDLASKSYQTARGIASYLDAEERPYIHLLDGGIADNLGLRTGFDPADLIGGMSDFLTGRRLADAEKILIIVVNAQTSFNKSWDKISGGPNSVATVDAAVTIPMYTYSADTISHLEANVAEWTRQLADPNCNMPEPASPGEAGTDRQCRAVEPYLVSITLSAVTDAEEREYLMSLPGSLSLPAADVNRLQKAARQLLNNSEPYSSFLQAFPVQ